MLVTILILGSTSFVANATVNSYWQRMEQGFANQVRVYEYVYEYSAPELEVVARLPQLAGSFDIAWQEEFNQAILDSFQTDLEEMKKWAKEAHQDYQDSPSFPYELLINFAVKLNQGGLLSIVVDSYSFTGGAHGMTGWHFFNIDLTTGLEITFNDLFATNSELDRAAELIHAKIVAEPEIYFITEFGSDDFNTDQGFYLQADGAVIYFSLYEIAPYASGIQEFFIPAP